LITGDDILIQYVKKICDFLSNNQEDLISKKIVFQIEKFITHYIWHETD